MLKIPRAAAYLILAVLFAAAIYMVYIADGIGTILPAGSDFNQVEDEQRDEQNDEQNDEETDVIGDDPADWDLSTGEFFVEYRLERERVRSKEQDVLQQMINNPNVTTESKVEAEKKLLKLQELMELELMVENAVKAQGFDNAILVMQEEGALVIVNATELTSEQIMLIAQIASQSTGLRPSQINISNQAGK